MKRTPILLVLLLLAGCDSMHSDGIWITAVPSAARPGDSSESVLSFVREVLIDNGLRKEDASMPESWKWRDPKNPPGMHATIELVGEASVRVRLAQDLYGPVDETETYRTVKKALIDGARNRFGERNVEVR
jgi:hypothetical protein